MAIQRLAQRQHDSFLARAQGRMQGVGTMGAVLYIVALEPFGRCGAGDVEHLGGLAIGQP